MRHSPSLRIFQRPPIRSTSMSATEIGTMLLLTVTDMNYPSPKEAYNGSINSGQMLPVYVNGEGGRNGHIKWQATTPDRQKCGSGDVKDLSSGSNLTVNTPRSC